MKGALDAPDGRRPHSHRMGKAEGKHQKAGVVRYSRHEGLAPVRLFIGLETGSGPLRANSCRTSDRSACLFQEVPVPGLTCWIRGRRVPFSRSSGFAAARSDKGAQASAIMKRRQPFTSLERPRNSRRRQGHTVSPGDGRRHAARGLLQGGKGAKKKRPGGRRKLLIRLNSAKEIQGLSWL